MQPPEEPQKPRYHLPPGGAPLPKVASSLADEAIPTELRNYLNRLEAWAKDNERDARRDAVAFWILGSPAEFVGGVL